MLSLEHAKTSKEREEAGLGQDFLQLLHVVRQPHCKASRQRALRRSQGTTRQDLTWHNVASWHGMSHGRKAELGWCWGFRWCPTMRKSQHLRSPSHSKTTVEMVVCASKQKSSEIRIFKSSVQNPCDLSIIFNYTGWLIGILVIWLNTICIWLGRHDPKNTNCTLGFWCSSHSQMSYIQISIHFLKLAPAWYLQKPLGQLFPGQSGQSHFQLLEPMTVTSWKLRPTRTKFGSMQMLEKETWYAILGMENKLRIRSCKIVQLQRGKVLAMLLEKLANHSL